MSTEITLPAPDLQIEFAARLQEFRETRLLDALQETAGKLAIRELDQQLAEYAAPECLSLLAGRSLRGEVVFPTPLILEARPALLTYYRLLYGYSQKEFFVARTGTTRFKIMEDTGGLSASSKAGLPGLCRAFAQGGKQLCEQLPTQLIGPGLLHDLTLLTLGPQLRGGANVRRGVAGFESVFAAIRRIVAESIASDDGRCIKVVNASGRRVSIRLAADPDVTIDEELSPTNHRHVIAIEVKAGKDFSNIHNRLGEAEKSHQKARETGYTECWTIVNVAGFDRATAKRESPSTDRFYSLAEIENPDSAEFADFRDRILALTGIPTAPVKPRRRKKL